MTCVQNRRIVLKTGDVAGEIHGRNCSRHIGADNSLAKLKRNIYHLQVTVKYYLTPACYSTFMKNGQIAHQHDRWLVKSLKNKVMK